MKHKFSFKKKSSLYDDSYKILKNNIQFLSLLDKHKVILVTSALDKEGKTTISKNLSNYLAKSQNKVLLVDFNYNNPSLHKDFEVSNPKGVSNILCGDCPISATIAKTNYDNLYLITCEGNIKDPTELLLKHFTKDFLNFVKDEFDYVIIDGPSVLSCSYIKILANLCDSTLFVACYGKTDKDLISKSKSILNLSNSNIIGGVLNKIPKSLAKNY